LPKLEVIATDADGGEQLLEEAVVCTIPMVFVLDRVEKVFNEEGKVEFKK
jgi:hypothetical protein